ncbi:MAG TPA: sugar ABC transporter ATP-binding protein [Rectinemataceae bacterium]|nr:sugar ABC transporter ATP-binding protein [Rectinemataceae bacterium]
MTSLRTEGITKEFPGVLALDHVDFELAKGEIHALVGENGAGKSTLVKLLAGVYRPSSGRILIDEKEVTFASPRDAASSLGVVHQERELVPYYSGTQNLFLGQEINKLGFLSKPAMKQKAIGFMKEYGLELDMDSPVSNLASGMQEMLTILKILFRSPEIVIFDEPTAPLSVKECEILFRLIHDLKNSGKSIIYISHHLPEVLELADRITVLRNGKVVTTVDAKAVCENDIIRLMIAKDLSQQYPKTAMEPGAEILKVEYEGRPLSGFSIRAREIVGFAGLVGSGRSELARQVFVGDAPGNKFSVTLAGNSFVPKNPKRSISSGIVMIPEDRRGEGLVTAFDVGENLALPSLSRLSRLGFRDERKIGQRGARIIGDLAIKVFSKNQLVSTLSGGNQQKVSLGKWFDADAKVWIFDEPTQGIDVETKSEIYLIMERLASKGAAVWFISSDLRELEAIADRILVMHESEIVGEFSRPFHTEKILEAMLGNRGNEEVQA